MRAQGARLARPPPRRTAEAPARSALARRTPERLALRAPREARALRPHRPRPYAGVVPGSRRDRAAMGEALYWMGQVQSFAPALRGLAGRPGGLPLDQIRDLRVGDLLQMIE
ncbi:hypothetical protein MPOCJGCO_4849 [Methylobacterium trifolii]|uniref:Uncharacterized protein n=1 Tax=Methylobacterium trifolii TaxID=1003092 RepID=A0ABQ4U5K1_9HYPH|nr:hypothetical protein MPOCJGCO_4849 [Methylobacterium trifolii]